MKNAMIILVNMLPCWLLSQCPETSHLQLIATYQAVATHMYESHWSNWQDVPKHLLLVGDDQEFLFGGEYSDSTFQVGCKGIPFRTATMNKYFLATFPYLNYQPTIIIGTPENTNKTPLEWTITLLHEHFHQLQFSHPNYFASQKALDLDKGDQSGMWMLNHPFPYEDSLVIRKIEEMTENLLVLHRHKSSKKVLKKHLKLKAELKAIVGDEHYRYLNLQLWQEGYARFLEFSLLKHWITNFDSIDQSRFKKNELSVYLEQYQSKVLTNLESSALDEIKRVYFYALGAAEAMLIEEVNPDWKSEYFDHLFSTDHLLTFK